MAEPTSTTSLSLAGLMITLFGAALGPYAAIVCAALAGAMYSVSRINTGGARRGVLILIQIVVTAVVLTGAVLWIIETSTGLQSPHLLAIVAFVIAVYFERWVGWGHRIIEGFVDRLVRRGSRDA